MTHTHPIATPTRAEIRRARRTLTGGTWVLIGAVCTFSATTGAQFIGAHCPWNWSGWVLAASIDVAFVMSLQTDATLARFGSKSGGWPAAFRWLTGAFSVFVNVGDAALKRDQVGVAVHLIAPTLLLVLGEAGPTWHVRLISLERTTAQRGLGGTTDEAPHPSRPCTERTGPARPSAARTREERTSDSASGLNADDVKLDHEEADSAPISEITRTLAPSPPTSGVSGHESSGPSEVTSSPDASAHPELAVNTLEAPHEAQVPAWTEGTREVRAIASGFGDPPADAHEARSRIVQGRVDGLSQRATARLAHRSPTYVRKVWTAMDDDLSAAG